MSLRWRVTATFVALGGLAGFVVQKFVLQPLTFRIEPVWLSLAAALLALGLFAAAPFLLFRWLTRGLRPRPATFAVTGGAFVAPVSPEHFGLQAIGAALVAGQLLPVERMPDTDRVRLSTLPGFVEIAMTMTVVLMVLGLAILWLSRPEVTLTPAGITLRQLPRSRTVAWDDLLPGGPHTPTGQTMRLLRRTPAGRPKRLAVLVGRSHIDRAFLSSVIRHYVERPEHRADIGTPEELDRLEAAYSAWRASVAPAGQR
ncbi:hypothetical protein [Dactylosporangium sp. NPDC005555]|uniref:hypothetical protein n=1 Tax=Dactylosporangium sp. NPDC005555 TaxID=3154889 RepID=UPI0033A13A9E